MLKRELEPEVMDTLEEARVYDAMNHAAVNASFCEDLLADRDVGPRVLDVGTGTALIPIELCRHAPSVHIVGIDLSTHMLDLGRRNVDRAGLAERITLERVDAKAMPYADGSFATTMSNTIVHHIPDPRAALSEMIRVTARGGLVFVRDLARPPSETAVDRLVALHAGTQPTDPDARSAFEHQRGLLRDSLRAALTVDEIEAMLKEVGLSGVIVRMTSDRHWTLSFRKP